MVIFVKYINDYQSLIIANLAPPLHNTHMHTLFMLFFWKLDFGACSLLVGTFRDSVRSLVLKPQHIHLRCVTVHQQQSYLIPLKPSEIVMQRQNELTKNFITFFFVFKFFNLLFQAKTKRSQNGIANRGK